MMRNNLAVIILAAGKSTRMKSQIPKVLHPICGRPMLGYVLDLVKDLKVKTAIAVLGYKHEEVKDVLPAGMRTVRQKKLLGTADAVKTALPLLKNFKGTVLILYGDNPLLKKESLRKLLDYHRKNKADATLLTATVEKPTGYGRIVRDKFGSICRIVEDKDADDFDRNIKEINTGIMCFSKDKLEAALRRVKPDNRKKEYYLTDVIGFIYRKGCLIESVRLSDIQEAQGVNSRNELAIAESVMRKRITDEWMTKGVTIVDPDSTFIGFGCKIGQDTIIYPFTIIESDVKIGKRCCVGPFAHLRCGTVIDNDVVIGNFLEVVRSRIASKTIAKHFCYLGDSRIGRAVNIGAGTVTANFDGRNKHITTIDDYSFIGSNTALVAPVKVGKFCLTGAGSVVIKNIPEKTTVVGVPAYPIKKRGSYG
ncbi:MAG: NTP transferase domain-containing protein [Candidatus Omnitrophica bacterium]|nr:NTP transferase domain-containing protein [Candidatus Omnitrophota bacterium]